jgi:hypothetical protein
MVPRTIQRKSPAGVLWRKPYETHRCYTRVRDANACDQRALPRVEVDAAATTDCRPSALGSEPSTPANRSGIEKRGHRGAPRMTAVCIPYHGDRSDDDRLFQTVPACRSPRARWVTDAQWPPSPTAMAASLGRFKTKR